LTSLLRIFSENLLPILLIAGAGFLVQRILDLKPRPISQVIFNIFTPALVLKVLITTQIDIADIAKMMAFTALILLTIIALAWLLSKAMHLTGAIVAAFILSAAFTNAGNYGLSLTQFAFGPEALAWASLFYVTSSLLINSVGVYIASVGKASPRRAFIGLLRVPAVYAIPAALIIRSGSITLPLALSRPIDLLGSAAVPSMLVVLGMQIGYAGFPRRLGLLGLASALRLIVSPALAYLLAPLFNLTGDAFNAGVVEAATPTAVLTSIIALEFDVEPDFVTGAILTTTLLSPFTITPLLAVLSG
jgi:predicted permease